MKVVMKVVMKPLALSLGFLILTGSSLAVRFSDNTVRDSAISEGKKLPSLAQIKLSNGETAYGVVVSNIANDKRELIEVMVLTGYPFTKDQADKIFSFTINGREYSVDFSEEALDTNDVKRGYFFRGILSANIDSSIKESGVAVYRFNPYNPATAMSDFNDYEEDNNTLVFGQALFIHGLVKASDSTVSAAKVPCGGVFTSSYMTSDFNVKYSVGGFFLDREDSYQPIYVLKDNDFKLVGFLGGNVDQNQPSSGSHSLTINRCNYKDLLSIAKDHASSQGFIVPKKEVAAFEKNSALFPRGALIGRRWILTSAQRSANLSSVQFPGQSSISVEKIHQLSSNDKLYLIKLASDVSGIAPVKRLKLPTHPDALEELLWKKHLITIKLADPLTYYTPTLTQPHDGISKVEGFSLIALNGKTSGINFPRGPQNVSASFSFGFSGGRSNAWSIPNGLEGSFFNEKSCASNGNPSCAVDPDDANNFALIGVRTGSPLNMMDKDMVTKLESSFSKIPKNRMTAEKKSAIEGFIADLKKLSEDQRTYGSLLQKILPSGISLTSDLLQLYPYNTDANQLLRSVNEAQYSSTITFMSDQVNSEIESITGIPAVDRLDSPYPAVSTSSSTSSTGSSSSTSSSSLSVHAFNSSQDIHFDPSFVMVPLSASSSDDFRMRFGSQEVVATSLKRSSTHHLAVLNTPILDDLTPLPRNISLRERALIRNMMIAWSLGDQVYLNSLKSAVSTFGRTSGPSVRLSSNPDSPDQNGLYLLTPNFVFGQGPLADAVLSFNGTDVDLGDAIYSNQLAGNLYFSAQPLFQNGPYSRVGSFHWIAAQLKNSIINAMIAESLKR